MRIYSGTCVQDIKLFPTPGTTYQSFGWLKKGMRIEGDKVELFNWLRIVKINGQVVSRETWASKRYIFGAWVDIPEIPPKPTPLPVPETLGEQLWQAKHDYQRGDLWRTNLPEVYRVYPYQEILLIPERIMLWRHLNPKMSDDKFCALLGNHVAFTNRTGFPGRRNVIKGEDMDQKDPALNPALFCGGACFYGDSDNINLILRNVIDVRKPLPTVQEVLEKHLYFVALNVVGEYTSRFPQGGGEDVLVPLFVEVDYPYVPISDLIKLPNGASVPSPYRFA